MYLISNFPTLSLILLINKTDSKFFNVLSISCTDFPFKTSWAKNKIASIDVMGSSTNNCKLKNFFGENMPKGGYLLFIKALH